MIRCIVLKFLTLARKINSTTHPDIYTRILTCRNNDGLEAFLYICDAQLITGQLVTSKSDISFFNSIHICFDGGSGEIM